MGGTRAAGLALVVVAASLTGCLLGSETTEDDEGLPDAQTGCTRRDQERSGQLEPGERLSVEASVEAAPASGNITHGGQGAGTYRITLTHDGEAVFNQSFTRANEYGPTQHSLESLAAGNYTLTARAQEGIHDLDVELQLAWGQGC